MTELALARPADFATQHIRHQLHAVADASTGVPSSNSCGAHFGAPASDTLLGPPERMIPTGCFAVIVSTGVLNGTISE